MIIVGSKHQLSPSLSLSKQTSTMDDAVNASISEPLDIVKLALGE